MHVTLRRYHHLCGKGEEFIEAIKSQFMPIISQQPHFVAYYAVEEKDGNISTLSIFEDEASAKASNHLAAHWIRNSIANLITMPPEIIAGEVIASNAP